MNESCRARYSIFVATMVFAAAGANAAEPIRWVSGVWDERGAPQGKLLTDNGGWWGERVWTGVSYSYEVIPNSPADRIGDQKDTFGNRLLDGSVAGNWHVPVGREDWKTVVAVFDYKRPCVFNEVDLVANAYDVGRLL